MASANPRVGGPLEGVRQRGLHLVAEGHVVEVATLDDPREDFLAEFPLPVYALGPAWTSYRYSRRLVPWLRTHASGYDAVIVNGLWQYNGFGTWRAMRGTDVPYYVFTHGMLDPWFKQAYPLKHLKKWLYWPWADYRVLRDARAVLFTSEEEMLRAGASFWLYRVRGRVIAYGTADPPQEPGPLREVFFGAYPDLRESRMLLFLSRIHEKKGCDLLIRAFADVAPANPTLRLVIAGPDQSGWVAVLKRLAGGLGVADRIIWPGMLRDDLKWGAFHCAEAFVLPSHQENFGIAVAEALGCGLPALISDKVNIWREVQTAGAGLVAPDTADGTLHLLREWLGLSKQQRLEMAGKARELFNRRYTVEAMAKGLLEVVAAA